MPSRWSAEQVLGLAPDPVSVSAASGLAVPARWSDAGVDDQLLFGSCAGSGAVPYRTAVDLAGPAWSCTCPSRKFPCKHALALLLLFSAGSVLPGTAPPYAADWKSRRPPAAGTGDGDSDHESDHESESGLLDAEKAARAAAAAAKRVEQRAGRVAAGLEELDLWLRDQVRTGFAGMTDASQRIQQAAARLVDAQAPGVASTLRRLSAVPLSGDGWPGRLLAEYGRLFLLVRAAGMTDPSPELASALRNRIGFPVARQDVLANPPIRDDWQILGTREIIGDRVSTRRSWLLGRGSGHLVTVLQFGPGGVFLDGPDSLPGTGLTIRADVHRYPGPAPSRVALGARDGEPMSATAPAGGSVSALLAAWADGLADDPWATEWPALVSVTPVADGSGWLLADADGAAVPVVTDRDGMLRLLAVADGRPVTVAGEWIPDGLVPMTVWHLDQAVPL